MVGMRVRAMVGAATIGLLAPALPAQAQKLEFDVASVRQSKPDSKSYSNFSLDNGNIFSTVAKDDVFTPPGGLFIATNQPLSVYINFAYKLTGTQFLSLRFKEFTGPAGNMPEGMGLERFDIQARVDGKPTKEQVRMMMQALLADRFKLAVHRETRVVPVFALTQAQPGKLGSRIRLHPADDSCSSSASTAAAADGYPSVCGIIAHLAPSVPGRLSFGGRNVPIELLASSLPTQTGMGTLPRPVIDQTGLSGGYDFVLEWALESFEGTSEASGQSFLGALRDQLGFKLVNTKGPVEVLIIDHVEHPTAN